MVSAKCVNARVSPSRSSWYGPEVMGQVPHLVDGVCDDCGDLREFF